VTSPAPEYLTAAEAAAVLRVSVRTVYRQIRAGHLAAFPVGRALRIHRSAVQPAPEPGERAA
jgi:excisionase family DNA binding protein